LNTIVTFHLPLPNGVSPIRGIVRSELWVEPELPGG
jgi:hypothetical protein